MFHPFTYDEQHRTYLARFSGTLTPQDMAAFDVAVHACRALHGLTEAVVDFSDVASVDVTTEQFIARAKQPQIMTGQKRALVANGMLFGMMRLYGTYQSMAGLEPMIVHSLAEAYEALGLPAGDFHPVALHAPAAVSSLGLESDAPASL